jgi:hypothetical protein
MSKSAARHQHLELVCSAPSSLPRYLYRRGRTYYFKRKIPADVTDAFPNCRGQVWKSLDTPLFERAKVMLAVEVTEFDLRVARGRNERATRIACVAPLTRLVSGTPKKLSLTGSSADCVSVAPSSPASSNLTFCAPSQRGRRSTALRVTRCRDSSSRRTASGLAD